MRLEFSGGGLVFRGAGSESDYQISVEDASEPVGGVDQIVSYPHASIRERAASAVDNNFRVVVSAPPRAGRVALKNLTPGICSLDDNGLVRLLTDGRAVIQATGYYGVRKIERDLVRVSGGDGGQLVTTMTLDSYPAGSLARHIVDNVLSMVEGRQPGADSQAVWSSNNYNAAAPDGTPNAASVVAGYDTSAMSMMNAHAGIQGARHPALLISPFHVVAAAHYPPGSPIVWRRTNGSYASASLMTNRRTLPGADLAVYHLDSSVDGITPFASLPLDFGAYLPWFYGTARPGWLPHDPRRGGGVFQFLPSYGACPLPALFKQFAAGDAWRINPLLVNGAVDVLGTSAEPQLSEWPGAEGFGALLVGGDSGSPSFIPVNGELVLLGAQHTKTTFSPIAWNIEWVQQAMDSLSAQYGTPPQTIRTADLSAFPAFPFE